MSPWFLGIKRPGRLRVLRWGIVFVWVMVIYASAFFAVPIAEMLYSSVFNVEIVTKTAFLGLILSLCTAICIKLKGIQPRKWFFLSLIVLTFILQYWDVPHIAKRYHLVEYSLLSGLIYYALKLDFKGSPLWVGSFFLAILAGVGDEMLQQWIPGRFGTWSDIAMNIKGALFGLMFVALAADGKTKNES